MSVGYLLLSVIVALASWWMTGLLRRYALARSLLDIPGERSSHSIPTPRGGGVAIVLTYQLSLIPLAAFGHLDPKEFIALSGAGALVAVVGFIDDHRHIAARWRLLVHFLAAAWLLIWLEGMPSINVLNILLEPGWIGNLLAAVYLVWLVNLYNFMDGIDGIAGAEAISVSLAAIFLYALVGVPASVWLTPGMLAAAVAGFLVWNFPSARIFMGDAGSGFLGLMLGALSFLAADVSPELFWSWQILLGVFVVDATLTLLRRVIQGERFYEAHRSHAYQNAARRFGSHKPVTLAVVVLNLLWLLPIAGFVAAERLEGVYGILIAYTPLVLVALYYNAGKCENRSAG